jgi:hypothetical protein
VEIAFDVEGMLDEFLDYPRRAEVAGQALVAEYAGQVRQEVIDLASKELSTRTAPKYIEGVGDVEVSGNEASIDLDEFATFIEGGSGPYVMPATGDVVPFFFWPRSQWRRRKKHSGTIINPKALPKLLQLEKTTAGTPTPDVGGGLARFRVQKGGLGSRLPAGLVQKRRPHHKVDIPAGMYRLKEPENVAQPGPLGMTFRTHSEDWRHPGIDAHRFFEQAMDIVDQRFPDMMDKILTEVL